MADQRDWDPEIDGAAAREGNQMRRAFRTKRTGHRPRGVTAGDVKRDYRSQPVVDILSQLNVICGKAER